MKISEDLLIKSIKREAGLSRLQQKDILIENFDEFTKKIQENQKELENFKKILKSFYSSFLQEILSEIDKSKEKIQKNINEIVDKKVKNQLNESKEKTNELSQYLQEQIETIISEFYSSINIKISNIEIFFNSLNEKYNKIKENINNFNEHLSKIENQLLEDIQNKFKNLEEISEIVKNQIESSKEISKILNESEKFNLIKQLTADISKQLQENFKNIIENISNIENKFKDIQLKLYEQIDRISDIEKETINETINQIKIYTSKLDLNSKKLQITLKEILENNITNLILKIQKDFENNVKYLKEKDKDELNNLFKELKEDIIDKLREEFKDSIKLPKLDEQIQVNAYFNEEYLKKQIEKILTTKLTKINITKIISEELNKKLKETKILNENQINKEEIKEVIKETIFKEPILPQYQIKNNKIFILDPVTRQWQTWLDFNTLLQGLKRVEEFGGSGIGLFELEEYLSKNNFKPIGFGSVDTTKVKQIVFDNKYFKYDLQDDGTLYIKADYPYDKKDNYITEEFILQDNQHEIITSYNITIGSEIVKLNGIILRRGENNDYIINNNKIILNSEYEIDSGDILEITYLKNSGE